MPQRRFKAALLISAFSALAGCASAATHPRHTICIARPDRDVPEVQCLQPDGRTQSWVPWAKMQNYLCIPPADVESFLLENVQESYRGSE